MFIKCKFYQPKTDSFAGNEYSYRCGFPVQPGDIVRVPSGDSTSVCRVTKIIEAEDLGCPENLLRDVICFEKDNPSVSKNDDVQLMITEQAADPEETTQAIIAVTQLPVIEERLLYIDDFFKGKVTEADVNLAFEILNYRYNNDRLRTVISSELIMEKIMEIDEAVGGRIFEKTKGFFLRAPSENWRLK